MRTYKILAIAGFSCIASVLCIIAATPSATDYEVSIYSAYPAISWILFIAAIACGIVILIRQAFAQERSNWWLVGLCIVIFSNAVFLGLPLFRGYAFYPAGDALTHMGYMKDIVVTGHLGEQNFYPIVHILGVDLLTITGLSKATITNLLSVFFSILYLLNMYLLATKVSTRWGQVLLITAFACPLIFSSFHGRIHPSMFSLFLLPLLLYFYHGAITSPTHKIRNIALLVLLALLITFFHPVTALLTIIVLLVLAFAFYLYRKLAPATDAGLFLKTSKDGIKIAIITSVIMLLCFFSWNIVAFHMQGSFAKVYNWLVYEITGTLPDPPPGEISPEEPPMRSSLYESRLQKLSQAEIGFAQTMTLFIYKYGAIFFYLLVAAILSIMVLRKSLLRKFRRKIFQPMEFAYSILFLVAVLISVYMLFAYAIEYNEIRIARLPLFAGTILCGLVTYNLLAGDSVKPGRIKASPRKLGCRVATGVIIIAVAALSLGSVYWSPTIYRPNPQVTCAEITGSQWFEKAKKSDIILLANSPSRINRLRHYNFGMESSPIPEAEIDAERLPSHFGYDEYEQIAEASGFQDRYMIIMERDKLIPLAYPEDIRAKMSQYTQEDFARLGSDAAVLKIYDNSGFELWRIYGAEA